MAVTPEIAARMRAGEQVSAEEIEAAVAKAQSQEQAKTTAVRNPNVGRGLAATSGTEPAGKKSKRTLNSRKSHLIDPFNVAIGSVVATGKR